MRIQRPLTRGRIQKHCFLPVFGLTTAWAAYSTLLAALAGEYHISLNTAAKVTAANDAHHPLRHRRDCVRDGRPRSMSDAARLRSLATAGNCGNKTHRRERR